MAAQIPFEMTDEDDAFIRRLVDEGVFPNADAVIQAGVQLLQEKDRQSGLRALLDARRSGEMVDPDEGRRRTEAMIARKKDDRGL